MEIDDKLLIKTAFEAREFAYAPYSHFKVGAALLAKSGKVFTGCNIESVSYSPTNCAERTALFKAVSEGEKQFLAIAVVGFHESEKSANSTTAPCGVCRQMLYEFGGDDLIVIMAKSQSDYIKTTLAQLLPYAFGPNKLLF